MKAPWLTTRDTGDLPESGREWLQVQWQAAKDLPRAWREDSVTEAAAGMTFFLLFSLFPALLCFVALLPYMPVDAPIDRAFEFGRPFLPVEVHQLCVRAHLHGLAEVQHHDLVGAPDG
jgi:uncharacterized BrkB/YihY/UPF0761 family membrane protein